MKKLILSLVLLLTVCAGTSFAGPLENIKSFCADKWSIDFEKQKYCVINQTENLLKFRERLTSAIKTGHYTIDTTMEFTDEVIILSQCYIKWQGSKSHVEWEMAEYCAKKQIDAYNELQKE